MCSSPRSSSTASSAGWKLTDAPTIFAARRAGAVGQLVRILGPADANVDRAIALMTRAVDALAPPGRPLFAGLQSQWDDPSDPWTRLFHLGDMLREFRGDAHVAAWSSADVDAPEIGLLMEAYIGMPLRTYVRTRAWNDEELEAAVQRLNARAVGSTVRRSPRPAVHEREEIECATDRALRPAMEALGDDVEELTTLLTPWGAAVRAAGRLRRRAGRPLALPRLAGHAIFVEQREDVGGVREVLVERKEIVPTERLAARPVLTKLGRRGLGADHEPGRDELTHVFPRDGDCVAPPALGAREHDRVVVTVLAYVQLAQLASHDYVAAVRAREPQFEAGARIACERRVLVETAIRVHRPKSWVHQRLPSFPTTQPTPLSL